MRKKVGLITFHASHNCGSMLQAYALQQCIEKRGIRCEIIDFSNDGQRRLYSVLQPNDSVKNVIKNIILFPHRDRIQKNYTSYEQFKRDNFHLTKRNFHSLSQLNDADYTTVVTGSDQVWNVTIEDGDDAYFLPWVKHAKKVAYAPSFGSKSLQKYANDLSRYKEYLENFDHLSIREKNGQKWIEELTGIEVPVLLDPTLLLSTNDYDKIAMQSLKLPQQYIFYYSPSYFPKINSLVKKVSKKYNLPVIAFNTKTFFVKGMQLQGFKLPDIENPAAYLELIKNASIIFTTSFHGTVFSSIYQKSFWTIKNGGMFGDDDRVKTLIEQLGLESRLISMEFDDKKDYMEKPDYGIYKGKLKQLQKVANAYLDEALCDPI